MAKSAETLIKIASAFFKPFSWVAGKLEEHYTGRLAGLPQALFVLGMIIVITSPFLVYCVLLMIRLPVPYCYISLASWFTFIGCIITGAAYVDYCRGKASIRAYEEFEWDIAKHSQEYLEATERRRTKRRKDR